MSNNRKRMCRKARRVKLNRWFGRIKRWSNNVRTHFQKASDSLLRSLIKLTKQLEKISRFRQ